MPNCDNTLFYVFANILNGNSDQWMPLLITLSVIALT